MSASVVSSSRRRPVRGTTSSIERKRPTGRSGTVHSCEQMLQKYVRGRARVAAPISIIDSSSHPHFAHSSGGASVFVRSNAAIA